MTHQDFELHVDAADGAVTLTPEGELDIATAPRLGQAVSEHAADGTVVTIDLAQVAFLDSTGLSVLIRARRDAQASGRPLEIVNPTASARRLFELTGTTGFLLDADGPEAAAG